MADATTETTATAQTEGQATNATPAGAQNTASGASGDMAQTVPYERFKEVNDELVTLKAEKAKREKADKDAEDARLKEQGKWQDLADKEKARADDAEQRYHELLRRAEFGAAVRRQKITFADDKAEADAMRLVGLEAIEVKDGVVDAKAVDDLVKTMAKERPYLLKQASTQEIDAGAGVSTGVKTPAQEAAHQLEIKQRYRL